MAKHLRTDKGQVTAKHLHMAKGRATAQDLVAMGKVLAMADRPAMGSLPPMETDPRVQAAMRQVPITERVAGLETTVTDRERGIRTLAAERTHSLLTADHCLRRGVPVRTGILPVRLIREAGGTRRPGSDRVRVSAAWAALAVVGRPSQIADFATPVGLSERFAAGLFR